MRSDHVLHGLIGGAHPAPEDIERYMARAHRMRSEAVHEYLRQAWGAIAGLARRAPARRIPTAQCG
jgi:hypothetical protein